MAAEEVLALGEGPVRVELLPGLGGRLHRLQAFGHDLLRTPADPAVHARDPFLWGGYLMAPWCNRIAAVPAPFGGQIVDLPSNFPDGSAMHGQVYAAPWQVKADGTLSVRGGGDGWPWPYECTLRADVDDAVLSIHLALTNRGESPMPGGIGLHPWFRGPLEVRVRADQVVPSNTDPAARLEPVSGPFDLREMRPMPIGLHAAWLATADPALEMQWPVGVRASVHVISDAAAWIVAASPSDLDAVAIEPQTQAAYGLERLLAGEPGAMQPIGPGATMRLRIELTFASSEAGTRAPGG